MASIDWEAAASYWAEKEPDEVRMPKDDLIAKVNEFLTKHKVCALG